MPILPENRHFYKGPEWKAIRLAILDRANHCCEGSPAYPECRAANAAPHPVTGSKVVLTIAHFDHDPKNNEHANLRAWCQRCHLKHDQKQHQETRKARQARHAAERLEAETWYATQNEVDKEYWATTPFYAIAVPGSLEELAHKEEDKRWNLFTGCMEAPMPEEWRAILAYHRHKATWIDAELWGSLDINGEEVINTLPIAESWPQFLSDPYAYRVPRP